MDEHLQQFVIRVEALRELAQARDIVRRIRLAPPSTEVVLEFDPYAPYQLVPLSIVAEAIESLGTRVTVTGLSRQDTRILRYLGVSLPSKDDSERMDPT
jgi:hypothetical protein